MQLLLGARWVCFWQIVTSRPRQDAVVPLSQTTLIGCWLELGSTTTDGTAPASRHWAIVFVFNWSSRSDSHGGTGSCIDARLAYAAWHGRSSRDKRHWLEWLGSATSGIVKPERPERNSNVGDSICGFPCPTRTWPFIEGHMYAIPSCGKNSCTFRICTPFKLI